MKHSGKYDGRDSFRYASGERLGWLLVKIVRLGVGYCASARRTSLDSFTAHARLHGGETKRAPLAALILCVAVE